jgi:hypothetical protein
MPLSLGDMGGMAIAFIVVAVTISIGASILVGVQQTQCTGGTSGYSGTGCGTGGSLYNTSTVASNITGKGITGTLSLGDWLPTIAIVVGAAVILGIVMYLRQ